MELWKEALIRYFAEGIKKEHCPLLGVEVEHFIVEKNSRKAIPYEGEQGIRQILKDLMKCYPKAQPLGEEDLLGFQIPEFNITLEPAAQLEISIMPLESIDRIGIVYEQFFRTLGKVLEAYGCMAVRAGGQPVSLVKDIRMIPKKRYDLMDQRFESLGSGGKEMMRGSASVQISIDYTSEKDFRNKLQAAYYYGPVFKLLCDNTPCFQGKPVSTYLKRTDIWRRVDPSRCGILPDIFSPEYSFADYADFLGNTEPIFLKKGMDICPTGERTVAELFENRCPDREEIIHLLSMVFPDVRLKQFLEIRFADSMPQTFMQAYCALVKGLLYSPEGQEFALERIRTRHLTEEDITAAEDSCMKDGWKAVAYGIPVEELVTEIMQLAEANIPEDEKVFLQPWKQVLQCGGIAHIETGR